MYLKEREKIVFGTLAAGCKSLPGNSVPRVKAWKVKVVLPGSWGQSQVGHKVTKDKQIAKQTQFFADLILETNISKTEV